MPLNLTLGSLFHIRLAQTSRKQTILVTLASYTLTYTCLLHISFTNLCEHKRRRLGPTIQTQMLYFLFSWRSLATGGFNVRYNCSRNSNELTRRQEYIITAD